MIKAPYVRPRLKKGVMVYGVRPTNELLKAFPDLKFLTVTEKSEANKIGYEWKRKLAEWEKNGPVENKYGPDSVNALIDYYKSSMAFKVTLTDSSRRSYLHHLDYLRKLTVPGKRKEFGAMDVEDVNFDYAEKLWLHIQEDISMHKANHCIKVLKIIWSRGLISKRVKSNVFRELKLPKLPNRKVIWEIEDVRGMIDYCDAKGYSSMGTIITMCFEFCQRPVDIRNFQWSHINGRTGVSNFIQQKTKKDMAIAMTNAVQQRLHLHSRRNIDDFICAYENTGRPYTQDRSNKIFRKMAKGYGLPEVLIKGEFNKDGTQKYSTTWLSDLRRTGATHAARAGCTDRELMSLTGHRDPQMLVVYAVEGEIESTHAQAKRSEYDSGLLRDGELFASQLKLMASAETDLKEMMAS